MKAKSQRHHPPRLEVRLLNSNPWMIVVLTIRSSKESKNLDIKTPLRKALLHKYLSIKHVFSKLSLLKSNNETVSEISTSSLDGNLITWDMKNILTSQKFSDLKI